MGTHRYHGSPVVALAYLVGPGVAALLGVWRTSLHQWQGWDTDLLKMVWIQHQKLIPYFHSRLCWIHCATFSNHCATLITYLGLNWQVEQEDNPELTGKVFQETSGQSFPVTQTRGFLACLFAAFQGSASTVSPLARKHYPVLSCFWIRHKLSCISLISHAHYIEDLYHCFLDLGSCKSPVLFRGDGK